MDSYNQEDFHICIMDIDINIFELILISINIIVVLAVIVMHFVNKFEVLKLEK